ncbi:hypothetical protein BDR07DRAFT_413666 [Suillus spraguei]|nr:hypothetical protein BDR07DRAFT_413666 [Suillus spraguei]
MQIQLFACTWCMVRCEIIQIGKDSPDEKRLQMTPVCHDFLSPLQLDLVRLNCRHHRYFYVAWLQSLLHQIQKQYVISP